MQETGGGHILISKSEVQTGKHLLEKLEIGWKSCGLDEGWNGQEPAVKLIVLSAGVQTSERVAGKAKRSSTEVTVAEKEGKREESQLKAAGGGSFLLRSQKQKDKGKGQNFTESKKISRTQDPKRAFSKGPESLERRRRVFFQGNGEKPTQSSSHEGESKKVAAGGRGTLL